MSLEIITGKTGEPHIDSEDIGAYNAYTIGKDSYLLNGLDMTITNVNTLHVGTGEVLFQGATFASRATVRTLLSQMERLDISVMTFCA